jgi:hypothetical protein
MLTGCILWIMNGLGLGLGIGGVETGHFNRLGDTCFITFVVQFQASRYISYAE